MLCNLAACCCRRCIYITRCMTALLRGISCCSFHQQPPNITCLCHRADLAHATAPLTCPRQPTEPCASHTIAARLVPAAGARQQQATTLPAAASLHTAAKMPWTLLIVCLGLASARAAHAHTVDDTEPPDGVRRMVVKAADAKQRWDQKPCGGGTPSHILQPRNDEDVALALKWASKLCLMAGPTDCPPVSIRSAGHHSACFPDNGVLLDLSQLTTVSLTSTDATQVEFGPGALARDVNAATLPSGCATVTPHISHVGMGGFIGGGGWGFLSDRYGFAVDLLVRVRVALPDGKLVWLDMGNVSESPSTDPCDGTVFTDECIAWALKASYSNFGVITRFVSRIVQLPSSGAYPSAAIQLPLAATTQAIRAFDSFKDRFKKEQVKAICLSGSFGLSCTFTHLGDTAAAQFEATVNSFAKEATHDANVQFSHKAYSEWLTHFDKAWPDGKQHMWRSLFAPKVDAVGDVIQKHMESASTPSTMIMVSIHPPALSSSLLAHKNSGDFYLSSYVIVDKGEQLHAHQTWEQSFWSGVEELYAPKQIMELDGFANEITSTVTQALVPRVYPASVQQSLAKLKHHLDPYNMLRANHNIAPQDSKEEL
eukprot:COSAG01_NODE_768_length_13739_cov_6.271334_21_plen_598_part_00